MAAEMKQLQEIFAEVVDRNARVAEEGKILDPQGGVIRNYADTGLPALLKFIMPAGAASFTLEVNGQRIVQPLSDSEVVVPASTPSRVAPVVTPVVQPVPPTVIPVVQPVPPPPPVPVVAEKPQNEWDKEPIDLELDSLAKSIDLEFADPNQPQTLDDLDLKKDADNK